MKQNVEFLKIKTIVEACIWDPLPTTVKTTAPEGLSHEQIVERTAAEYGDDLIGLTIYEINLATINGVKYESEPLNKQEWLRPGWNKRPKAKEPA